MVRLCNKYYDAGGSNIHADEFQRLIEEFMENRNQNIDNAPYYIRGGITYRGQQPPHRRQANNERIQNDNMDQDDALDIGAGNDVYDNDLNENNNNDLEENREPIQTKVFKFKKHNNITYVPQNHQVESETTFDPLLEEQRIRELKLKQIRQQQIDDWEKKESDKQIEVLHARQKRQKELKKAVEQIDLTQEKHRIQLSDWDQLEPQVKTKKKKRHRKRKSENKNLVGELCQLDRTITNQIIKLESNTATISTHITKQEQINAEHSCATICKAITEKNINENIPPIVTPTAIDHKYDTSRWNFTIHDCTDPIHIFAHLQTNKTLLAEIEQRYVKDSLNDVGKHKEQKEYKDRVQWHIHTLGSIPMIKFQVSRESLRKNNSPGQFRKRMSQFPGTQFEDYMASILPRLPSTYSYFAVDADNKLLFVYLHNFVAPEEQVGMLQAAVELLVTNGKRSPNDPRHVEDGAFACHLTDWSMQGQPDSPCISLDVIGKGGKGGSYTLEATTKFTKSLRKTRLQMSSLLEVVDQEQHAIYLQAAYERSTETYRKLLRACNQDVFLGCVLNNGRCKNHRDWLDIVDGLSCMTPLGYFINGDIVLPQLGVRIPYQPGNMFMCSTELLEHFIASWTGYRIGTVHSSRQCHTRETVAAPHQNIAPATKRRLIKTGALNIEIPVKEEKKRKELSCDLPPTKRKKK